MGTSDERIVAVIMVGEPTTGTQFRPLSLNVPKPLIPLAEIPLAGICINNQVRTKEDAMKLKRGAKNRYRA